MGKTEVENNPYGVGNQQLFEQSLQKGRKSDIAASRKYNFGWKPIQWIGNMKTAVLYDNIYEKEESNRY